MKSVSSTHIPLVSVEDGQLVKLVEIKGGAHLKIRLATMNIKPGTEFKVLKSSAKGPFILGLNHNRLILGHGIIQKLIVTRI